MSTTDRLGDHTDCHRSLHPLLACKDLVVGYSGTPLLPPVDVELRCGEFWAVIGRNGSGKSTWFKTLLGLIPPISGTVSRRSSSMRIAYLAQRTQFDALYPVNVAQVVSTATLQGWSFLRPSWGGDRKLALEALEAVDALDLADRTFRSLSEGQKQRVLFARLVASGAPIAFLDEPTVAMDAVAEREAMELLDRLRERYGLTIVVVTHYLKVAKEMADRVLFVDPDGQQIVVGEPDEVFRHEAFIARYGRVAREVVDD